MPVGTWNYNFDVCLISDFRDIFLGTLARQGKGVTLWNLMLDDEHKPYRPGGCGTCWGGGEPVGQGPQDCGAQFPLL